MATVCNRDRAGAGARALRVGVLAALAAVVLLASAPRASAVVVRLKDGATVSYQPAPGAPSGSGRAGRFDKFFTNLDYNGGPVMPSNTNYAVYWDPEGGPAYPSDYQPGLDQFFEDLAHDSGGHENVDSVSSQYNDTAGQFAAYDSHFGGALDDKDPYPPNGCTRAPICLTDEQIRAELTHFVSTLKLPTDLTHEYFLFTPEGVEDCFEEEGKECSANVSEPAFAKYCAYHGNIPLARGGELIYANDPFVTGKNCDEAANHPNEKTSDGALIGGLSHEHNESLTDPVPNDAWTDFAAGEEDGQEIGDKCRTLNPETEYGEPLGKATDGANYNQVINGHFYWYQQEWSNRGHQCVQRLEFKPSEAPTATFTAETLLGDEVAFDATGSTTGAGVHYNWQFNDQEFPFNTPVEQKALTLSHLFPEPGAYTVALTVFKPDGTSYGTAREVTAVERFSQAVSFTSAAPQGAMVGGPSYTPGAVASSGLPVALASLTPSVCAMSGSSVSFIAAGTCTIEATQAGDSTFGPSPPAQQSFGVAAKPPAGVIASPPGLVSPLPPSSAFGSGAAAIDERTGAVTLTESLPGAGVFSWLLTFQNGRFGVFAASTGGCKAGLMRLRGRCRPARVVYARGSRAVSSAGAARFTIKPTSAGLAALRRALKQKRGLPVLATLTFTAAGGGAPVTHAQSLVVRLKR